MNEILFGKRIVVTERISIHHEVQVIQVARSPQEILTLLVRFHFHRHPDVAIKHALYLGRKCFIVFFLQQLHLTVHFGTGKEVDNHLTVFRNIVCKLLLVRCLNSHNHLRRRIGITRILEFGLRINVLNIYNNDVTEQTHRTVKKVRPHTRNTERAFSLRQSRHIRVQHMKQCTVWTHPAFVIGHHHHFIRASA